MAFNGLRNAGLEIKNIMGGTGMKVALAAIAIIPCLYGALYLAAFMDPYDSLDAVPVAIVNLDEGAEINGEERNVGEEVCEDIAARSDGLQWNFVSEEEAIEGMEAGQYYMICTIPSDFSEKIASADSSEPEAAELGIEYNESANMLASQIGQSVWQEIQTQISDSITRQYWNTVLTQSNEAGESLEQAASSAEQLATGVQAVEEGNSVITEGISSLGEGASALGSGLSALASGSEALVTGIEALVSSGSTLSSGASALSSGTSALAEQIASLSNQTSLLATGAQAVDTGLQSAIQSIGSSDDISSLTLAAASQAVTDGLSELASGLSLLQDGTVTPLKEGLSSTKAALDDVAADLNEIAEATSSDESSQDTAEQIASASSTVTEAADDAESTQAKIQSAQQDVSSAQDEIDDVVTQLSDLAEADTLNDADQELVEGLLESLDSADSLLDSASESLESADDTAASAASNATEAAQAIEGISSATTEGVSAQIKAAAETLESISTYAIGDTDDEVTISDSGSTSDSSATLFAAVNALSSGLDASQEAIGSTDTASISLVYASSAVTSGLNTLSSGLSTIRQGSSALSEGVLAFAAASPAFVLGIEQLDAGAQVLALGLSAYVSGTSVLAQSVPTFVTGLSSVAEGTEALVSGADALAIGSEEMGEGLSIIADGNQSLADQLSEGASDMRMAESEIEDKAEMMSSPVELSETYYTEVDNYGTGFAPYFIGIGLWVGCLVEGFAIRSLDKRLVISGANPFAVAFSGFVPLALFAAIQALILMMVLQFVLGLQIEHVLQFYAFGLLSALAFAAIMQLLMAAFGFSGRFVAIILLVLQLTSSAGTFPIETVPTFFQVISPLMPMTYVVEGMRQLMTGIGFSLVLHDAAVLAGIVLVCFMLTALVAYRKRSVSMVDLHPVLKLS